MKRQLTDVEKKFTKKGIVNTEKDISDTKNKIKALELGIEFVKAKRAYEDFTRPLNRIEEDKGTNKTMKMLTDELNVLEKDKDRMQQELKYGIEVKETNLT